MSASHLAATTWVGYRHICQRRQLERRRSSYTASRLPCGRIIPDVLRALKERRSRSLRRRLHGKEKLRGAKKGKGTASGAYRRSCSGHHLQPASREYSFRCWGALYLIRSVAPCGRR